MTRREWCFLVLVCAVAAGLRFYHLDYKSLWYDEAVIVKNATGDPAQVIEQNAEDNSAPPLYTLILNQILVLDDSVFALRSFSALGGVLGVVAVYGLGRALAGVRAGAVAALLLTLSTQMLHYSQELREYSWTFTLAALLILAVWRFLQAPRWGWAAGVGALGAVAIATQYGLALLIFALNLIVLGAMMARRCPETGPTPPAHAPTPSPSPDRAYSTRSGELRPCWRLMRRWSMAQVPIMLAVGLVWVTALDTQRRTGDLATAGPAGGYHWDESFEGFWRLLLKNSAQFFRFAYDYHPVFIGLFGLGLWWAWRQRSWRGVLVLWAVPQAVTFVFAMAQLYRYHGKRQDMMLMPMFFVMVGLGWVWLDQWARRGQSRKVLSGLALALLVLGGWQGALGWLHQEGAEQIHPLVAELERQWQDGDRVFLGCRSDIAFNYYSQIDPAARVVPGVADITVQLALLQDAMQDAMQDAGRLWLLISHCVPSENRMLLEAAAEGEGQDGLRLLAEREGAWLYLKEG